MSSVDMMPDWVWRLVAAVEDYEQKHGHPDEGWTCLAAALEPVPADVRDAARLAKRWTDAATADVEAPEPYEAIP